MTGVSNSEDKHHLYRHFDADGNLLYVGVSISSLRRLSQHKLNSHWFDKIANVTIQKFSSRFAALTAETNAIREEKPLYNIAKVEPEESEPRGYDQMGRTILYRPLYEVADAGKCLGLSSQKVNKLIADGKLGCVNIGTDDRPDIRITGWQLIDYIEWLMKITKQPGVKV